jgi:hypothetical protein
VLLVLLAVAGPGSQMQRQLRSLLAALVKLSGWGKGMLEGEVQRVYWGAALLLGQLRRCWLVSNRSL